MMTPEQQAAYVNAQAACASAELEAMKAANQLRDAQGLTITYGKEHFLALIDKYGLHHNAVMTLFGS